MLDKVQRACIFHICLLQLLGCSSEQSAGGSSVASAPSTVAGNKCSSEEVKVTYETCRDGSHDPIEHEVKAKSLHPFLRDTSRLHPGDKVLQGRYLLAERLHLIKPSTELMTLQQQPSSSPLRPTTPRMSMPFLSTRQDFSPWIPTDESYGSSRRDLLDYLEMHIYDVVEYAEDTQGVQEQSDVKGDFKYEYPYESTKRSREDYRETKKSNYRLKTKFGRGGFGEVWLAFRHGSRELYVIKRLLIEKGEHVKMSGLREIHFGYRLRNHPQYICRYVEYLEEEGQLWIVFRYEGISLHNYLYEGVADPATQLITFEPSARWRELKRDTLVGKGAKLRNLLFQITSGVAVAHALDVVHRDIKPSNILMNLNMRQQPPSAGETSPAQSQPSFAPPASGPPSPPSLPPLRRTSGWFPSLPEIAKQGTNAAQVGNMLDGLDKYLPLPMYSWVSSALAKTTSQFSTAPPLSDSPSSPRSSLLSLPLPSLSFSSLSDWFYGSCCWAGKLLCLNTSYTCPPSGTTTTPPPSPPRPSSFLSDVADDVVRPFEFTNKSPSRDSRSSPPPRVFKQAGASTYGPWDTPRRYFVSGRFRTYFAPPSKRLRRAGPLPEPYDAAASGSTAQGVSAGEKRGLGGLVSGVGVPSSPYPLVTSIVAPGGSDDTKSLVASKLRVVDVGAREAVANAAIGEGASGSEDMLRIGADGGGGSQGRGDTRADEVGIGGDVRVGDFGNGVDVLDTNRLYGPDGPSRDDSSMAYAPPEVLFGSDPFAARDPKSYDMWSLGVLMLEILLGSPDVFSVDGRTRARIEARLGPKVDSEVKQKAILFRAFVEYCIYDAMPKKDDDIIRALAVKQECNETHFLKMVVQHDPVHLGPPDIWFVRLIRRLLQWDPARRISAEDALTHAFFVGPYVCPVCGEEFELQADLESHLVTHAAVDDG